MPRPGLTWYLSGPMSGHPEMNFPLFDSSTRHLRGQGFTIVSPHEIEVPLLASGDVDYHACLREDFRRMVEQCQGIILLRGWPRSRGARAELDIACELGWPVMFLDGDHIVRMDDPQRGAA